MFEVNIYLETSLKGPRVKAGWCAAVLEYIAKDGKAETREDFLQQESTTYHRQTLCALIKSLERLNASCTVNIYSDSVFVEAGLKKHLKNWKSNGFLASNGEQIKNISEWKEVARLTSGHKINFYRVKRHKYSVWMMVEGKKVLLGALRSENKAIKNLENAECEEV